MSGRPARYAVERVAGSPELERLQDRLRPMLERLSQDADSADGAAQGASTAGGTTYSPANASDWTGVPPTTVAEALDRVAAALGPI